VKVRLLGTAAGGGFPQWNCACPNCDGLRRGTIRARPRREFCVAVTGNDRDWFLINAPPDVHAQIASFAPLAPRGNIRSTSIAGVLLTSADLDNVLGLMVLREGPPLTVYATAGVQQALEMAEFSPSKLLQHYAAPKWQEPAFSRSPLLPLKGRTSGLNYQALEVDSHQPRYLNVPISDPSVQEVETEESGYVDSFIQRFELNAADRIGYRIWDTASGSRLVVLPGVLTLTPGIATPTVCLRDQIRDCDLLLLDGTFWSENELEKSVYGARSARGMGHLRVGGLRGSLEQIKALDAPPRIIYVHINNTNPMLNEDSPEHKAVRAAGAEVGYDGLEIEL
jgi:pyrroloquinoline quinone biosynthesis protein B